MVNETGALVSFKTGCRESQKRMETRYTLLFGLTSLTVTVQVLFYYGEPTQNHYLLSSLTTESVPIR